MFASFSKLKRKIIKPTSFRIRLSYGTLWLGNNEEERNLH